MSRIEELEAKVKALYEAKNKNRAHWADWLYPNHVVVVANFATELAARFGADSDLSRAAALLHDIADINMKREDKNHEQESLNIARKLLQDGGYSDDEVKIVVDDAIRFHSCHDGEKPESLAGKVLATADALAHFKTDFYVFATWSFGMKGEELANIKEWVLKKIDRDLNNKIQFDEVRDEVQAEYEQVKELYSR